MLLWEKRERTFEILRAGGSHGGMGNRTLGAVGWRTGNRLDSLGLAL